MSVQPPAIQQYELVPGVITGEAVFLDIPPAGIGWRFLGSLIDIVLQVGALIVMLIGVIPLALIKSEAMVSVAEVLILVLVLLGYPTAMETFFKGRTIGKMVVGTRTVRLDAATISFTHAFTRALIGMVEIWACQAVLAILAGVITRRTQRLGDLAAGTYVIRERAAISLPPPAQMPPHLEPWARSADIGVLPTGLAIAMRQFISRQHTLSPQAREHVVAALFEHVLPRVSPPPPQQADPVAVLSAILAERRSRESVRMRREQEVRDRLKARKQGHPSG